MLNKINYSQGWNWGEDIYRARSRFKPYWHALRNPITSVLHYCKRRNIKLNKILEVGCGGGNFGILFIIHNLNVYFIDAAMGEYGYQKVREIYSQQQFATGINSIISKYIKG